MNIERMRRAVAFWTSIPSTHWNMDLYYFTPNNCGCALGHLAHNEVCEFKMAYSSPAFLEASAYPHTGFEAAEAAFGLSFSEAHELFGRVGRIAPRGDLSQPTHKQIFFLRLDKLLADKGIPMSAVYGPDQREDGANGFDDEESHGEHPVSEDELT